MERTRLSQKLFNILFRQAECAHDHGVTATSLGRFSVIFCAILMPGDAAWAQSSPDPTPIPPEVMLIDGNKVNLGTSGLEIGDEPVTMGQGDMSLSYSTSGSTNISEWGGMLNSMAVPGVSGSMVNGFLEMHVQWGMHFHNFLVGSTQTSNGQGSLYSDAVMLGPYFEKGAGNAKLSCTGGSVTQLYGNGGTCTVTEGDGTQVNFVMGYSHMDELNHIYPAGAITSIIKPDGEIISRGPQNGYSFTGSSRGFASTYNTVWPPTSPPGTYIVNNDSFMVNASIDYCGPTPATCIPSAKAVKLTNTETVNVYSSGVSNISRFSVTVNGNVIKTFIPSSGSVLENCLGNQCDLGPYWLALYDSFKLVSPLGVTKTYIRSDVNSCQADCTATLTVSKQNTTTYQFYYSGTGQLLGSPTTTTINYPNGSTMVYSFQNGVLTSVEDQLHRITKYQYFYGSNWGTKPGRPLISRVYAPNSPDANHGYTQYDYTHGALSKITVVPIDGSPNLVTQYGITLNCDTTNYKICNKPQYVIDPKSNRTDYTYDPAHGGVLTETRPADVNGVRPQKRYTYSQLYPKVLDSSGALVNTVPLWRLTKISECRVATAANPASCVGTADEKVTTYVYNNNNVFLTSVTTAAGDGSDSATISYSYDYVGNVTSVKGPRTDVDDTRYTTYDSLRRKVFEIGADPDSGGPLPRPIVHHLYDADGNEVRIEVGIGNATDGSDFVINHFKRMTYDGVTGLLAKVEEVTP